MIIDTGLFSFNMFAHFYLMCQGLLFIMHTCITTFPCAKGEICFCSSWYSYFILCSSVHVHIRYPQHHPPLRKEKCTCRISTILAEMTNILNITQMLCIYPYVSEIFRFQWFLNFCFFNVDSKWVFIFKTIYHIHHHLGLYRVVSCCEI